MADDYICLIFAAHREPRNVEVVAAEDDQIAVSRALRLMHKANAHGYELWRQGKKIASYFAPSAISVTAAGKTADG